MKVTFEYFDPDFYVEQARLAEHLGATESFNHCFMRISFLAMNYANDGRKIEVTIGNDLGSRTNDFVWRIQEVENDTDLVIGTLLYGGIEYHGPGQNPSADAILRKGNEHRWQIHT